jgi:hypothetical protein
MRGDSRSWMLAQDNAFEITRKMGTDIVTVRGRYNEETDSWEMSSWLAGAGLKNGSAHIENRNTTDVWLEAEDMIECAFESTVEG